MTSDYHLYYRKNGFIVPYLKFNGQFWSYALRRLLAFIFDNLLFVLMTLVLSYTTSFSVWSSMLLGVAANFIYILASISLKNNRSLGMIIGRMRIGDFEGKKPSNFQLISRAVLTSFCILPFIGWFIVAFSIVNILMSKGLSPIDLLSKTQIFDQWKLKEYIDINQKMYQESQTE